MKQNARRVTRGLVALILMGSLAACAPSKSTEEWVEILQLRGNGAFSAALALGDKKDPQAIKALIAALGYDDAQLRKAAIMGLDGIDDPDAIAAIILALQDGDSSVREEAQRGLEFVIGQGYNSVEPAIARLREKNPATMEPLVEALEAIQSEASSFDRPKIIAALGQTQDDRAIEPILTAIQSDDEDLRLKAVAALGNFDSDRAIEALTEIFTQNRAGLQETAAIALAQSNHSGAIDTLLTALNDEATQATAAKALGYSQDERVIATLIDFVREPNSPLQAQASQSLARIGTPAVEALISELSHDDSRVRANVAVALGQIGDERAIAPLKANLTDWFSNQVAAQALQQLGWQPQSDRDSVHLFVAQRQGEQLNQQWETTKTVLLDDVGSGNSKAIENALFAFIGLGREEVVSTLTEKLNTEGDKEMALVYLNSGHAQLETAARSWAQRNGYRVYSEPGASQTVAWGAL